MSKVAIDQKELKHFIRALGKFNSNLEGDWRVLRSAWHSLQSTWHDPELDKFEADWGKVILQMEGYLKQAGDYVGFLSSKDRALDDYGSRRRR